MLHALSPAYNILYVKIFCLIGFMLQPGLISMKTHSLTWHTPQWMWIKTCIILPAKSTSGQILQLIQHTYTVHIYTCESVDLLEWYKWKKGDKEFNSYRLLGSARLVDQITSW